MEPENENNFQYRLNQFYVQMTEGHLFVDGVVYEELDDDPTYTFAREVWKLKNKIA